MPMTNLEVETCHAIKGIKRELIDLNKKLNSSVDWEQRRYEIAKEIMPKLFDKYDRFETMAEKAVDMADYLIQKLKEKK